MTRGFDPTRNAFTQSYGSPALDASLLMLPLVGFLSPNDPRVLGTVAAIERDLMDEGFVRRYQVDARSPSVDGLPPGEGVFLPCSFWMVDNYVQAGRLEDAARLFERVLAVRSDLGLLSEEYDPRARRLLGNFPQAFTHLGLVVSAHNLAGHEASPAVARPAGRAGASAEPEPPVAKPG